MKRRRPINIIVGTAIIVLVFMGAATFWLTKDDSGAGTNEQTGTSGSPDAFDKQQYSIDDPNSPWVVVNKKRQLSPKDYAPSDLVTPNVPLRTTGEEMKLRKATADALQAMFADAKKAGLNLMLSSGYRSYNFQVGLYNRYVKEIGQASADTQSARPGYSEHQTGMAADIEPATRNCEVEVCFADTPEGKWLAANAHAYGFIIRYTPDKTAVTGYTYEPWHIRFVGTQLANELKVQNIETLEEFFGLPAAPDYN